MTADTVLDELIGRVAVGDCRLLSSRIPDNSCDLVLSDPPYGIGFDYGDSHYTDDRDGYLALMRFTIAESERIAKPGALCFVFCSMPRLYEVFSLVPHARIFAAAKNFVNMGYPNQHRVAFAFDPVLFWAKPGGKAGKTRGRDYHVGNTAATMNRGLNAVEFHACPRPLDTIIYMLQHFSSPGGLVCDLFMGSGTTGLAAKMCGRRFIGFELDPDTARQAQARIDRYRGMFDCDNGEEASGAD